MFVPSLKSRNDSARSHSLQMRVKVSAGWLAGRAWVGIRPMSGARLRYWDPGSSDREVPGWPYAGGARNAGDQCGPALLMPDEQATAEFGQTGSHTGESDAGWNLDGHADPIIGNDRVHQGPSKDQANLNFAGVRMAVHVGERFLHRPVDCHLGALADGHSGASGRKGSFQPGATAKAQNQLFQCGLNAHLSQQRRVGKIGDGSDLAVNAGEQGVHLVDDLGRFLRWTGKLELAQAHRHRDKQLLDGIVKLSSEAATLLGLALQQ